MALHAVVYCNCYETGKMRTKPPRPEIVCVLDDGSLSTPDLEDFSGFYKWLKGYPCDHKNGWAVFHSIGNIAGISFLREQLSKNSDNFPIVLSKILYNGTHTGEFIPVEMVEGLRTEINQLRDVHLRDPEEEKMLRTFQDQMLELICGSLEMGKPISF